jgi:hypothetical protein
MADEATTRREILKKAAYATPVLITLKANLEFASAGSGWPASRDQVIPIYPEPPNPGTPTPGGPESPPSTLRPRQRWRDWLLQWLSQRLDP